MPTDLERWKTRQIEAAISRGVNAIDATRALEEFIASVPPGADPATYVRSAYTLEENLSSESVIGDTRAAWYGDESVSPQFKRLLDAKID